MEHVRPHVVIVIPSYNEPDLQQTIDSLFACGRGNFCVEILLLLNSYQISPEDAKDLNRKQYKEFIEFAATNNTPSFYLTPLLIENLPGHQTGAGLPRKIGMDEAVSRFQGLEKKRGIIVSLDADTVVDSNYLTEIEKVFRQEKLKSATIQFHHPTEHLAANDPLRQATKLYELYLRYYRDALEYIGYPYAYYTIGSAFAVTAEAYRQVGGMGKQQAGEDFYFLQKIFPLGKTKFIDTTRVYPQARISDRVPFGTGPAVEKMMKSKNIEKKTYQLKAFQELKLLFDSLFKDANLSEVLPSHTLAFLKEDGFEEKIIEIRKHTANAETFRKRFFSYFSAFKILKYLNYVHPEIYALSDVEKEYSSLKAILSSKHLS